MFRCCVSFVFLPVSRFQVHECHPEYKMMKPTKIKEMYDEDEEFRDGWEVASVALVVVIVGGVILVEESLVCCCYCWWWWWPSLSI